MNKLILSILLLALTLFGTGCTRSSQANDNPPPPIVTEEPSYPNNIAQ